MTKQTKWADVNTDDCERRKYRSHQTSTRGSSTRIIIDCPFCETEVLAYMWSLAGGGKRCTGENCGAIFGSYGVAYRLKQ